MAVSIIAQEFLFVVEEGYSWYLLTVIDRRNVQQNKFGMAMSPDPFQPSGSGYARLRGRWPYSNGNSLA